VYGLLRCDSDGAALFAVLSGVSSVPRFGLVLDFLDTSDRSGTCIILDIITSYTKAGQIDLVLLCDDVIDIELSRIFTSLTSLASSGKWNGTPPGATAIELLKGKWAL
jgi:hypothetical protein